MKAGFLCGPAKGTKKKPYRCICCAVAFNNPEALGVSICWNCMGGNPDCPSCVARGVPFQDFFDETPTQRMHRFARWAKGHKTAIMRCGLPITRGRLGQAIAAQPRIKAHRACWPGGYGG
jgi:hypothetical protein